LYEESLPHKIFGNVILFHITFSGKFGAIREDILHTPKNACSYTYVQWFHSLHTNLSAAFCTHAKVISHSFLYYDQNHQRPSASSTSLPPLYHEDLMVLKNTLFLLLAKNIFLVLACLVLTTLHNNFAQFLVIRQKICFESHIPNLNNIRTQASV